MKTRHFPKGRAWIELNQEHLQHNIRQLNSLLPSGSQIMPVIKANAYGHGMVEIAKELAALNIHSFCVATVEEGMTLRKNGIAGSILILGYTHPNHFHFLCKYHLIQTVIDAAYASLLNDFGKKIPVHVKIDTGMHRLGERNDHFDEILRIFAYKNLVIKGLYTHLSADDSVLPAEMEFTQKQADHFFTVVTKLQKNGYSCPPIHLQASYGLLNYPALAGDFARIGIALYGVLSKRADLTDCPLRLLPVLTLKSRIALIKDIKKDEYIGYGLESMANQNKKIAVLSIGYADGLPRSLSNGNGSALIHGYRAPIIGFICMDQTIVDITGIADVSAGDIAVLIGKSGNLEITVYDLAEQSDTITNEILSRLGERLERVVVPCRANKFT